MRTNISWKTVICETIQQKTSGWDCPVLQCCCVLRGHGCDAGRRPLPAPTCSGLPHTNSIPAEMWPCIYFHLLAVTFVGAPSLTQLSLYWIAVGKAPNQAFVLCLHHFQGPLPWAVIKCLGMAATWADACLDSTQCAARLKVPTCPSIISS